MYEVLQSNEGQWALLEGNRVMGTFFHEEDALQIKDILNDMVMETSWTLTEGQE